MSILASDDANTEQRDLMRIHIIGLANEHHICRDLEFLGEPRDKRRFKHAFDRDKINLSRGDTNKRMI
jgi:hypothetical protein